MKKNVTAIVGVFALLVLVAFVAVVTGCGSIAGTATKSIVLTFPAKVSNGDIIEHAIDVGRELNFPAANGIDKSVGVVSFGDFGKSMIGITAQARVKGEGQLEVTISKLEPLSASVDKEVEQFKTKWDKLFPAPIATLSAATANK